MNIKFVRVDFDKVKKNVISHGLYSEFCTIVCDWLESNGFEPDDFLTEIKGGDDLNEIF